MNQNLDLLERNGLRSLADFIRSARKSKSSLTGAHWSDKRIDKEEERWAREGDAWQLSMQHLIRLQYLEKRQEAGEEKTYLPGADTVWKFERLRDSLQFPVTKRYSYPLQSLNRAAMNQYVTKAHESSMSINHRSKSEPGPFCPSQQQLILVGAAGKQKQNEDTTDSYTELSVTVAKLVGVQVPAFQKEYFVTLTYTDQDGHVHEICSETKRTPVWDFGATLYLKKSDPDWEKTALLQFSVHSHQGRGQTECWVQGASLRLGPFFPTNENSKGLVVFESTTGLMVTTTQLAADQEVDLEKFSKHSEYTECDYFFCRPRPADKTALLPAAD